MSKFESKELATIIREWQSLENDTISLTEKLFDKTENAFVKAVVSIIKHDSEKRRTMLQFALSHMNKGGVCLPVREGTFNGRLASKTG